MITLDSSQRRRIAELMTIPYSTESRPGTINCLDLVRIVQKEFAGRDMLETPNIENDKLHYLAKFIQDQSHEQWRRVDQPVHLGLVELSYKTVPHHVGVYLDVDGGKLLHAVAGAGVCFDRIFTLKTVGWRNFIYYDWIG